MEKERLNKYIASCGICSRREADRLIEAGLVTVNGARAETGMLVNEQDKIFVNGKPVQGKNDKVVLAYYKPVGVTCTEKDKFAEKTIASQVRYPVRVTYAGRLDKDSEGLLLLSNDGELINAMMRGSAGHEKEYMVRVNREITGEFVEKMKAGVYLSELDAVTKPCKVEKTGKFTFKIILTQGLNRQIKRMVRELGYHVLFIKRTRVVNIRLGTLRPGEYRRLSREETQALYDAIME
ncbi:MAG: pseudouridine synthase [Clostridium sp.]|nr:pseudouridine synthase [Clostridium sp.]